MEYHQRRLVSSPRAVPLSDVQHRPVPQPVNRLQAVAKAVPASEPLPLAPVEKSEHVFVRVQGAPDARQMPWRAAAVAPVSAPAAEPIKVEPAEAAPIQRQFAPRRHVALDMSLPGAESPARRGFIKSVPWRQAHKWAVRVSAATAVLLITLGGLFFSQSYLKLHQVFRGTAGTAAALKSNVSPDLLKGEGSGRVNVLLLGRGGGNHDGPDLTDTMMVASIDPITHKATLVSIPRDLWVTVPDGGAMKINAAWETGEFNYEGKIAPGSTDPKAIQAGFTSVDQTVESVLGITIDYNVLVDFQAFQQAVDTVGGVSVNVPTDLVDPTMAWENGGNPVLAKAGTQIFDGKQALIYVRSRETTSDFARAERQRSVLLALKQKVETLGTLSNPLKISGLLSDFGNNVSTDLSLGNADRLYSIMSQIGESHITSIDLDGGASSTSAAPSATSYVTTGNMNGQSIVLPKAGLFNYTDIQNYIRQELPDPYIQKEDARILILNGTSTAGLATTEEATLKSYGYNVVSVGNTPTNDYHAHTTLIALNKKDKYTEHYLQQRLGVTALNSLSDQSIATGNADFVIIVGNDQVASQQTAAN